MTDPVRSSADETAGKYSRDAPITFDNLLVKQTSTDQDPFKFRRDDSPAYPDVAEANRKHHQQESDSTENDRLKELEQRIEHRAEAILERERRTTEPSVEYGSSTTSHSSPRWYSLRRTRQDNQDYYYLLCEQYTSNLEGQIVIVGLGAEVEFSPLSPDREVLFEAIEQQRRADFRAARRPVQRLRPEQVEALQDRYRRLVRTRVYEAREGAEERHRDSKPLEVYDCFVVSNDRNEKLFEEVLSETLLPRQQEVVSRVFVDALVSNTDMPPWVWQQGITVKHPIIAGIGFEYDPTASR